MLSSHSLRPLCALTIERARLVAIQRLKTLNQLECQVTTPDEVPHLPPHSPALPLLAEAAETETIRLGDRLIANRMLTPIQLERALAEQRVTKERLGTILTRNGFVRRDELMQLLSEHAPTEIRGELHFTTMVPPEVLLQLKTIIITETASEVFLASPYPEQLVLRELQPYYPDRKIVFASYAQEQLDEYLESLQRSLSSGDNLLESLLRRGMSEKASDIHILPRQSSYTVMVRRLGKRLAIHEGPLDEYQTLAARIKDMARLDIAEKRLPQDGAFSFSYNGKNVDFRVATVPLGSSYETIVMRILDADSIKVDLNELGITELESWRKGTSHANGLCFVCGPTGSGKTTTLLATILGMDRFERSINTLEDPVEYRIPFVNQVSINNTIGLNFAKGVRAFMRADPDVIVVGEIRDDETAENAVRAAETGHLVLATLHTESIFGTLGRLRHLGVSDNDLSYLLRSILVQNLMRTVCKQCQGKGCRACRNTGYAGRTVVSECAYFSSERDVQRMINGEKWWVSLTDDVVAKVDAGVTTHEEALRDYGEAYLNALKARG